MPVIVIGADTEVGEAVASALTRRQGEVRAFITDPASADHLRGLGIKVAVGDVSDGSHIEGAAHRAFCAVVIAESAEDDRERSFASTAAAVAVAWAEGLKAAAVQRLIWVGPGTDVPPPVHAAAREVANVDTADRRPKEIAALVVELDDVASLGEGRLGAPGDG